MVEGPLFSGIVSYAIPIILTGLLQLLFNAADLVVVGRYCGSISIAAVSATGALTNLIVNLFIGLSVGVGVSIAHGIGGNHSDDVHRTVHTAFPLAIVSGIVLTIVGVLFSDFFLKLMNTPDNVRALSSVYMRIYFSGITFSMVYNFCAAILRAAGDSKSPLIYLSTAGVINVLLNLLFVRAFNMNVAGVALATAISQAIAAVLVVVALIRRKDICCLKLRKIRFYKQQLLKIIRTGLPAGIQSSLFSISNVIIQSSINSFNSEAIISGNGAAANIEGFIYTFINGFPQTAVNYIGQNTGAHRYDRVKKIFGICLLCSLVTGVVISALAYIFGRDLLSIYIVDSPEAIVHGMVRLTYICLPYFLTGLLDTSTCALRGLGVSFTPMLISILGICGIRILWIYTVFPIPQYHTPECLYLTYTISWIITFLIQTVAFIVFYKKKHRKYLASISPV